MKRKLLAIVTLSVLLLNSAAFAAAVDRAGRAADASAIVALLPASDGVVVFDIKRFLDSALPQLLSGNQAMLAEVTRAMDDARARTGIDVRQFDVLAAGITAIKVKEGEYDFDSVLIARGQVDSGAVLAAAKIASKGKYREEKAGERTIYIFEARDVAAAAPSVPQAGTKTAGLMKKALGGFSKEMAAVAIDSNTIAFGSVEKVKESVSGSSRVDPSITGLLGKTTSSVANFAARVPEGMSAFLPLDNDELGKNIDSIKYLFGSMDVVGKTTRLNATARTLQADQALSLKETLDGLQVLGKVFLGSAKGADKQVYARLIDNVKFTTKGNDVTMDLAIAQTDIDFLVGLLTK